MNILLAFPVEDRRTGTFIERITPRYTVFKPEKTIYRNKSFKTGFTPSETTLNLLKKGRVPFLEATKKTPILGYITEPIKATEEGYIIPRRSIARGAEVVAPIIVPALTIKAAKYFKGKFSPAYTGTAYKTPTWMKTIKPKFKVPSPKTIVSKYIKINISKRMYNEKRTIISTGTWDVTVVYE